MLVAAAVAFAGSLVKLCARAATVDVAGRRSRRGRRARGGDRGAGAVTSSLCQGRWLGRLPAATAAPSLDRVRVLDGGNTVAATNLITCVVVPTSSIYGTARRGPTSRLLSWASPIRTRVKGPVCRWANWWRSILTFSILSHLTLLNFST